MCLTNLLDLVKPLPHTVQQHVFSPAEIIRKITNFNLFAEIEKNNGKTSKLYKLCDRRWQFKSDDLGKRALQNSHPNGRSPVCLLKCTVRFDEFEKLLPQKEHKCVFFTSSRSSTGIWTRIWDLQIDSKSIYWKMPV